VYPQVKTLLRWLNRHTDAMKSEAKQRSYLEIIAIIKRSTVDPITDVFPLVDALIPSVRVGARHESLKAFMHETNGPF
jgi:hypothetical protein